MRTYIKKRTIITRDEVANIRCDVCGKYVVKNGKTVSSWWKALTELPIYYLGDEYDDARATYDICHRCFTTVFKRRQT